MIDAPRLPDTEFSRLPGVLRRSALPILAAGLLAGGGAYLLSARQTPVYEATSSLIGVQNPVEDNAQPSTPPSSGVLAQALHSPSVVADVLRRLAGASLSAAEVSRLQTELQGELANGAFSKLQLEAPQDGQQGGLDSLHARDRSAVAAAALANAGVAALQDWDVAQVQGRLTQAQTSLERQLAALSAGPANDATRSGLRQDLARVRAQRQGVLSTLEVVSAALPPARPVSPQPRRSALIAALLALLAAGGLAVLLDSARRRIEDERDLARLGLPLLGRLPRLTGPALTQGVVGAARTGPWYEGAGFLRVNLLSQLPPRGPRRIVVSSAQGGEGKSSVTAALAEGLAAGGLRVLVLDADPYRRGPALSALWPEARGEWHPVAGGMASGTARSFADALEQSGAVQVLRVAPNVDLLPAGGANLTGHARLAEVLERWSAAYDALLIDTPPLLSLADATALAAQADGLVLVVEAGVTPSTELDRALSAARTAGARVLGVVLNRAQPAGEGRYRASARLLTQEAGSAPANTN